MVIRLNFENRLKSHSGALSCKKSVFSRRFHFIFPNVSVGLSDPRTLAELEAASRDHGGSDAATTLDLFHKYKRQTCAFKSAASIVHDDVILPRDARSTIVTCLAIFKQAAVVEQSQNGQQQQTMFRM